MIRFYDNIFASQSTPEGLSTSTIHPLVKSYKKSLKSFNNYRGISIIPVFTKILEYIILLKCPTLAESHHLQHGYKKWSSTIHAEFLIRETLHFYNKNGSPVYICGLDAEKAFDSCNWDILFEKLYYEKNLPLSVVNVIKSLYINGTARVKYSNMYSEEFQLSQGVRQGSVLSPHLYNIYTEELLRDIELNVTESGTTLYGHYTGILMYADDIILMSTTLQGLKDLVKKVSTTTKKNCINFNADKTEFCISNNNDPFRNSFVMNGYRISPSDNLKHLGVLWNLKRNIITMDDENVELRISKFWSVIQTLIREGVRFCHPQTIRQLFNSLAVPTLTYGLELCNLNPSLLKKLDTVGRKGLKSLFNISVFSKNYLHTLLNIKHISTRIIKNKYSLLTRLLHGKTAKIVFNMLRTHHTNYSFLDDLAAVSNRFNIDLIEVVISRRCPLVVDEHNLIDELTQNSLLECLNNWTDSGFRKRFLDIMEERVVRR